MVEAVASVLVLVVLVWNGLMLRRSARKLRVARSRLAYTQGVLDTVKWLGERDQIGAGEALPAMNGLLGLLEHDPEWDPVERPGWE